MNLSPESRVGEIASRYPLATRVFARHRLYQPFYPATAAVGAPISRVPVFRGDTR